MMPFILRYKEILNDKDDILYNKKTQYSKELNLTIDIETRNPLIFSDLSLASTITMTKSGAEGPDKDNERRINNLMATATRTDTLKEVTDSDPSRLALGFATGTYTETKKEVTDQDR
ncbi:hypothetical protein [Leptospira interrogans]|uniref:hypothetical protein n=1 Tax=Leptospira interrogans TaxID=173 RepID=UPI0012AEB978|nr:hypothetical protein [Leptospira interrogans]